MPGATRNTELTKSARRETVELCGLANPIVKATAHTIVPSYTNKRPITIYRVWSVCVVDFATNPVVFDLGTAADDDAIVDGAAAANINEIPVTSTKGQRTNFTLTNTSGVTLAADTPITINFAASAGAGSFRIYAEIEVYETDEV